MRLDDFIQELYDAGWQNTCDGQHTSIKQLHKKLFPLVHQLERELRDTEEEVRCALGET